MSMIRKVSEQCTPVRLFGLFAAGSILGGLAIAALTGASYFGPLWGSPGCIAGFSGAGLSIVTGALVSLGAVCCAKKRKRAQQAEVEFQEALKSGNLEKLEKLTGNLNDINIGNDPLIIYAARTGNMTLLKALLDRQDYTLDDKKSADLLGIAIGNQDPDLIVILANTSRININAKNSQGRTPLMIAASMGFDEYIYVKLLLNTEKIELDAQDNDGNTALHLATSTAAMKLLIDQGADQNKKNVEGKDAYKVQITPYLSTSASATIKGKRDAINKIFNRTG